MQIRSLWSPFAIRLLAAWALALTSTSAFAVDARLSWSFVSAAAGYKIYERASGGTYGTGMDVGAQPVATDGAVHFTVANVSVGTLVAVTSYDATGLESTRSNELAVPAPVATATAPVATTTAPVATTTVPPPVRTATAPPVATATPAPIGPSRTRAVITSPTANPTAIATQPPKATLVPTAVATLPVPTTIATQPPVPTTQPPVPTTQPPVPTVLSTRAPLPTGIATPVPLADLTMQATIIARVTAPTGGGNHDIEVIRDGDRPPPGNLDSSRQYDTYDGTNTATEDWIGYSYATPQRFRQVMFQEGRQFWNGGWFDSLTVQVHQNGQWVNVSNLVVTPRYSGLNALSYETFWMSFTPMVGDAIRIDGQPGGSDDFISVGELRVYGDGTGVQPVPVSTLVDVTAAGTIVAKVTAPTGGGNHNLEVIRDGDMPPLGNIEPLRQWDSFDGANTATDDWVGYTYATAQTFRQLLFQKGMEFWDGGWFNTFVVQVRQAGVWTNVAGLTYTPIYFGRDGINYEAFMLSFAPVAGDGIRIYGRPGGTAAFISVGELRAYANPVGPALDTTQTPDGTPASPDAAPTTDPTTGVIVTTGPDPVPTAAIAPDATPVATVATPVPPSDPPSATCGNGRREPGEECDGADDAQCPDHCRSDCACAIVVELPLTDWTPLDDGSAARLVEDDDTGTVALSVTDADGVADATSTPAVAYPADATLGLALSQLAFSARASAAYDLEVAVRAVDDARYTLVYRAADASAGADGPVVDVDGARATFATGAVMAQGEVGTIYRDLGADLAQAFATTLATVDQVRIRGHVEVFRVAIASDRGRGEDTAAELTLPVAGWEEASGNGTVSQHVEDDALPGFTLSADSSGHPGALEHLTYPADDTPRVFPFRTLAFAVRDADSFTVRVQGVTASGDNVDFQYSADNTAVQGRLDHGELPLTIVPRAAADPYGDVRLNVAADVATMDSQESLASITSVTLIGTFTVGDVQLRDPLGQ